MGGKLAYPDVSAEMIHEIYKQSQHERICAYGFFVDLPDLYERKRSVSDPGRSFSSVMEDMRKVLEQTRLDLLAAGLNHLSIAHFPTPKNRRKITSPDNGWLIILVTGFKKTSHAPVSEELVERVQAILATDERPTWWLMSRLYGYPSARWWIKHKMQ
ncbi:unnamed protein product [Rhizoctonia solani]|uniref:Uncharacterized protein n=1 Tax=Rhizoctonia solani TaxID=456999 RepID=A0A8H3E1N3_9AGAM|nr:unnamed protein product [Rhizoctonia solani]